MYKIKHYLSNGNEVNKNKSYFEAYIYLKEKKHIGAKWLIHGTKRRKDNQLQSLELPCIIY